MADPQRVLLLGDTHGNTSWTLSMIDQASALDADLILQLGDFGYWPRVRDGLRFLSAVEKRLGDRGLPLWFIDGNHEDHVSLRSAELGPGFVPISDHVTYLPRGTRWTWDSTEWLAVGGASSVDRNWRREGISWFPEEILTASQERAITESGSATVVVAHDAPWGVSFLAKRYDLFTPPEARGGWPADALRDSDRNMVRMRSVADSIQPRVWYHGHHHVRYDDVLDIGTKTVDIHGLSMDGTPLTKGALLVDNSGTVLPWPVGS